MRALPKVFLLSLVAACGGEPSSSSPTAENVAPIIGGIVDQGHAYVVGVGGNGGPFCTGTVISRRTVITAGHCFGGITRVFFGTSGGQAVTVAQEIRHPSFSNDTLANDLAILKLAADSPAQPAPLLRETLSNTPAFIGPKFTFVGYGNDDNGNFGTRRVVTFPIAKVGPGNVGGSTGSIDATQFYYAVPNKNTCNGDSGGPAFAVRGGVERHAGTTSFGDQACEVDGVQARTDLAAINGFIQARIDQFEGTTACRNNGVCDESCNTGGQVWDPDCQEFHCAADELCAIACVAPADPDCTGVNLCGANGVCDPTCTTTDPDCGDLCPGGCADAGTSPMIDAGTPPPPIDAAPPPPPPIDAAVPGAPDAAPPAPTADAAPVIPSADAAPGGGDEEVEGETACGCRVGGRSRGALRGVAGALLLLLGAAWTFARRRRAR